MPLAAVLTITKRHYLPRLVVRADLCAKGNSPVKSMLEKGSWSCPGGTHSSQPAGLALRFGNPLGGMLWRGRARPFPPSYCL